MEDQGKRLLIAVAAAFAIMVGWSFLFPPEEPEKKKETPTETADEAKAPEATAPGATAPGAASTPAAGPATVAARGPEKEIVLGGDRFRVTFSTWGGAIKSWQLLGEQFYAGSKSTPEDLVRADDEALWPFQISFPGSTHAFAVGGEWQVAEQTDTKLVFQRTEGALSVTKTYTVHPGDFLVGLTIDVAVSGAPAKQTLVVSLGSFQDPKKVEDGGMAQVGREWKAACYANEELSTWSAKGLAGKSKEVGGEVGWFGFVYPYFMAAAAIEPRDERVTCRATGPSNEAGPMLVEAAFAPADVVPGTPYRRTLAGYFGPKYMGQLENVAVAMGWEQTGFEKSIDLGWLGFLAGPLLWLLSFFHRLVPNWPLAIVLLTITVKLATLYWTHKSMKSMKAMSRLRPQLDAVKEKYKDDRQRQQVETMNLFKEHGVNPLAGCLPMLLQMPIWFALYKALSVAAELYQAPFLWINDLTAADPYFVLPVFMTAMMLVQALMTPTTASGMQQKMLSYGMPILFGAMSLFFPAGLTLYISTNSILTLLHHLYMRAEDKRHAAAPTKVAGPTGAVIDVEDAGEADDEAPASGGGAAPAGARKALNGAAGRKRPKGGGGRRRGARS